MKLLDRWIKSDAVQALLATLVAALIWLFYLTVRWRRHVDPETQALFDAGKPLIICTWHGRMFFISGGWRKRPKTLGFMTSAHRDGRLIGGALERVGYIVVHGSSGRGGAKALSQMCRLLQAGTSVALTPDGPKGPRMRMKAGAIKAAQISGVPLVALTGSTAPRRVFETWDRFCLPMPFSRGLVYWGPPIYVPREADEQALEHYRLAIEQSLNGLTNEAERALGQEEIQAAMPEDAPEKPARRHARA